MKKLALLALVALALPGAALAKGPSRAVIVGPGVTIRVAGDEGGSTPFWNLVEATGWFESAWGPARLPQEPPAGNLGPRLDITWTVPSSNVLHQTLYPYAQPDPVTYTPRGQAIYGTPVEGGWFSGGATLARALAGVGLPSQSHAASPPTKPAEPPRAGTGSGFPAAAVAMLLAVALLAAAGVATSLRRRSSGAAGT